MKLFELPETPETTNTCKTCIHRQSWQCNRTSNNLLKIKRKDKACVLLETEIDLF